MNRTRTRWLLAAVVLLGIAAITACELLGGTVTITFNNTVQGTVVDARINPVVSAAGIASATVTMTKDDGTVSTTTTDSTGAFSFTGADAGLFTVTASKDGYAFIPKDFAVAGNELAVNTGKILGFGSTKATDISLITVWSGSFDDVDAYLTFPTGDRWTTGTGFGTPAFPELYTVASETANETDGFFPDANAATANRETVYYGHKESDATTAAWAGSASERAIVLDVDVGAGESSYGFGPETITIKSPPVPAAGLPLNYVAVSTQNALPAGYTYAWIGVMELYVDAYSPTNLSTEGQSGGAKAEVYFVQGSSIKGRFVLPDYITIGTASVVRINMFLRNDDVSVFQFVPDLRIAATVRGLTNTPVVLEGPRR